MNKAAMLDLERQYKEEAVPEIDLRELIVSEEPPSRYHTGNPDSYFDLQDTQEMHYIFGE